MDEFYLDDEPPGRVRCAMCDTSERYFYIFLNIIYTHLVVGLYPCPWLWANVIYSCLSMPARIELGFRQLSKIAKLWRVQQPPTIPRYCLYFICFISLQLATGSRQGALPLAPSSIPLCRNSLSKGSHIPTQPRYMSWVSLSQSTERRPCRT